jgi:hypothetical protein
MAQYAPHNLIPFRWIHELMALSCSPIRRINPTFNKPVKSGIGPFPWSAAQTVLDGVIMDVMARASKSLSSRIVCSQNRLCHNVRSLFFADLLNSDVPGRSLILIMGCFVTAVLMSRRRVEKILHPRWPISRCSGNDPGAAPRPRW